MTTTTHDRTTGLGASEAAAAIGIDPYKSRFALWAEKTGQVDPKDLSDNEAVEWGLELEPLIARKFAQRTGRWVRHNRSQRVQRHPDYDFMFATLDAIQRNHERLGDSVGALEVKTTNAFAVSDWKDEAPLSTQVQLQHQLAVRDYSWGSLACLIGGQKLVWFDQDRNDRFIATLIEHERAFWDLVESRTPPPVDGSAATSEALKRLYAADNGDSMMLPAEAADWDQKLQEAKATIKGAEAAKREAENELKAAIGEFAFGVLPDGGRYKWKKIPRAGYTVEPGESRPLVRLKK